MYEPDRDRESNDYFSVATTDDLSPVTYLEACRSYEVNSEVHDSNTDTWFGSLTFYINQALAEHEIGATSDWIDAVKDGMKGDRRLRRQNMVIERSQK